MPETTPNMLLKLLTRAQYRACVEIDGKTPEQLAKQWGISPRAVRGRIERARKRLQEAGLGQRFTPYAKPRLVA